MKKASAVKVRVGGAVPPTKTESKKKRWTMKTIILNVVQNVKTFNFKKVLKSLKNKLSLEEYIYRVLSEWEKNSYLVSDSEAREIADNAIQDYDFIYNHELVTQDDLRDETAFDSDAVSEVVHNILRGEEYKLDIENSLNIQERLKNLENQKKSKAEIVKSPTIKDVENKQLLMSLGMAFYEWRLKAEKENKTITATFNPHELKALTELIKEVTASN